jgi:hypothetical protein
MYGTVRVARFLINARAQGIDEFRQRDAADPGQLRIGRHGIHDRLQTNWDEAIVDRLALRYAVLAALLHHNALLLNTPSWYRQDYHARLISVLIPPQL